MRMFLLALVALFVAASEPALAQAAWRVSEASGDVRIVEGGRSRPAIRGALLSSGSVVATAARARAVLVRGRDYVIVSPASRVRLPNSEQGLGRDLVQMIAEAGTSMYRIQHRATPHFAVRTPYLAAVVKGTVFTVTVSEAGASVQVTEGAVEVSTADGGAAEMVRPGMIATVSAADLQELNIQGENSRSIRSNGAPAPGAVVVPPSETGNYQGPTANQAIIASITEEPVALSEITGGLVEGNAVDLALADTRDAVRTDSAVDGEAGNAGSDTSGPGTANGDGSGGGSATPANDGGGNVGNAGDGDTGGSGATNGGGGGADTATSGDDGNNGHGNDADGDDAGNPGNGGGNDNSGPGGNSGGDDAADDDGNNGHGNDADGDDAGNPGNGGGNDNSGPGNNNGGGNDDASNSGNGGGNDNSGPGDNGGDGAADDDGNSGPGNNNGGGNDDPGNSGNGGGNDNSGPGNDNGGGNDDSGNSGNGGGNDNSGPGNNNGGGNGDDD